ncbi:hypothetical protein LCGC14_2880040, partial [marine sediment metagenome]
WLEKFKSINPSFQKDFLYGMGSRVISAGLGDIVSAGGGLAGWAKQEKLRENMLEVAEVLQSASPENVSWHGAETLLDPRFWQTTVLRTLTFSVALIPGALAAAYTAAPVAGLAGLGALGTTVLTVIFGAAGRGVTEAAFESGSVYNEAKAMGFTNEEASRAAGSVYWKNSGMFTALSVPEFAFAFGVNPFGIALKSMLAKGLVRVGRFGVPALTEGGQELAQDIFTRQALGQPIEWDDEAKLAVVLGAILGIGVGAGGNAFSIIQSRFKARFTPEMQEVFDTEKSRLEVEGLSPEGAELRAMDAVAETEEGKSLIEDIAEEVGQAELEKVIAPEDKVEKLAIDHTLETQREAPIEEIEEAEIERVVPEELPTEIEPEVTPEVPAEPVVVT